MAITTGAAVYEYGSQTTVINESGTITASAFSTNVTALTVTDDVPLADAVLAITYSVAPAANEAVHLYRRALNIDGTNDAAVPDANFEETYMGSFMLDLVTSTQYLELTDIPLIHDQEFYIKNDSAQTISAGMTLKVTPKSFNVK